MHGRREGACVGLEALGHGLVLGLAESVLDVVQFGAVGGRYHRWRFCFRRPGRASRTFTPRWMESLSRTTTRGTPRSGGRACCRKATTSSPFQGRSVAH